MRISFAAMAFPLAFFDAIITLLAYYDSLP